MSEDKTEQPSKQKLKKARQRGEVAKSPFLAGALIFVGGLLLLWALQSLFSSRFELSLKNGFAQTELKGAFQATFAPLLLPILLFFIGMFCIALAAHLFQTGWIFAPEQIRFKWRKKRGEKRVILPLLQLLVVFGLGYLSLRTPVTPSRLFISVRHQEGFILKKLFVLGMQIGAALLFLGLCDLFYQKWRYFKQMHMSKEELRQEKRESEGNPEYKGRLRDRSSK